MCASIVQPFCIHRSATLWNGELLLAEQAVNTTTSYNIIHTYYN